MNEHTLRKLQLTELEILTAVARICDDNNLRYYLLGGTLLGAVRHKGFIPWDDDLDIGLPREDFNRFLSLCKEKNVLGTEYSLHHISTDKNYWLPFAKVRKNNTIFDEISLKRIETNKGIFIDVFPLDYTNKNHGLLFLIKSQFLRSIRHFVMSRRLKMRENNLAFGAIKMITCIFPTSVLLKVWDALAGSKKAGKYVINYGSNYKAKKQTMLREIYGSGKKVDFEGIQFSAPELSEKYLEHLFGNWKALPPLEERTNHNPSRIVFDTCAVHDDVTNEK